MIAFSNSTITNAGLAASRTDPTHHFLAATGATSRIHQKLTPHHKMIACKDHDEGLLAKQEFISKHI
jgi:hypothetical protein